MKENAINWDAVPDVITKDQLYRICHISKSTALYLLQSGKIPCEYTGRKTRCYKIKKEDVIAYLENRKVFPESYSAPAGWYKGDYTVQIEEQVPPIVQEHLRLYYTELLSGYPDVLTTQTVSNITGYGKTSINNWCNQGHIKSFPEKQRQPHSEGLFGGILLFHLLSHHHPQIAVAHPYPARLFKLAENP